MRNKYLCLTVDVQVGTCRIEMGRIEGQAGLPPRLLGAMLGCDAEPHRAPCGPRIFVMNLLHVSQPSEGGVAGYVAELLLDQIVHGWNVTVACPTNGPLSQRVRDAGGRHVGWPASRTPSYATLGEALRLKTILRKASPDLVHLHSSKAGLCGRLILRGRLGTIFQPHGWSFDAVNGPLKDATIGWNGSEPDGPMRSCASAKARRPAERSRNPRSDGCRSQRC